MVISFFSSAVLIALKAAGTSTNVSKISLPAKSAFTFAVPSGNILVAPFMSMASVNTNPSNFISSRKSPVTIGLDMVLAKDAVESSEGILKCPTIIPWRPFEINSL